MPAYVFGYGSLADWTRAPAGGPGRSVFGRLEGFARGWDVAMENAAAVSDPKHYVDERTGERPDVAIAFVNVRPDPERSCNGLAFPVDDALLAELDRREVNYDRVEAPGPFVPDLDGPLWVYVGTQAGRRRAADARAAGRLVVSRAYVAYVRSAFARRGEEELRIFEATTYPLDLPQRDLRLVQDPPPVAPTEPRA